jgi:glucose-6-phosphate dehydrogenase assembly protein OpcA
VTATAIRTPTKAVAPRAIPDALRAIWRECCSGEPDENVSRSLTMNLLAVTDAAQQTALRGVVDGLAARRPCRAFLVAVRPGSGTIEATVHGAARVAGRVRDLVLEQIELNVPQGAFAQVAGVLRPLLVNDLPTHCYWGTTWPADPRTFDGIDAVADFTIVDSARFRLPATELDAIEQRRRAGRPLTDLNWLRLRPWRRALAEVFERAAHQDGATTTATLRHGDAGLAAAALLGRWLEQRLAAHVALEPAGSDHDGLVGFELQHADALATATLTDGGRIEVAVETRAQCFLPYTVPASRGAEGDLLAAAIDLA